MDFHVVTWESGDESLNDSDHADDDMDGMARGDGRESVESCVVECPAHLRRRNQFVIYAYGREVHGQSVCVRILNFRPFFYFKVARPSSRSEVLAVRRYLTEVITGKQADTDRNGTELHHCTVSVVNKRDVWGYQRMQTAYFLKVEFFRLGALHKVQRSHNASYRGQGMQCPMLLKAAVLYESNIEPVLRFVHLRKLPAAGRIHIDLSNHEEISCTKCDISLQCDWRAVSACDDQNVQSPLRIASFDIECHSVTGRFPVASSVDYVAMAARFYESVRSLGPDQPFAELVEDTVSCIAHRDGVRQTCMRDQAAQRIRHMITALKSQYDADAVNKLAEILACHSEARGDPVVQIGVTLHRYGETDVYERKVFTLGECGGVTCPEEVVAVTYEKDLLLRFAEYMREADPDIITGYNIFGFDFRYLVSRALCLGIYSKWMMSGLSRHASKPARYMRKELSSSALGDNVMYYVDMHGRTSFDLMKIVQRDHRLDSYKLDNVAETFLGERKHDVTPAEIFAAWNARDSHALAERARVAEYCMQDCALCNRLVCMLNIVPNTLAMATVCFVPVKYIFLRGQGVKIFSLVLEACARNDVLFPTIVHNDKVRDDKVRDDEPTIPDDEPTIRDELTYSALATPALREGKLVPRMVPEYEGAIVLTPKPGIYVDHPVAVLDYASLYPSSMISENISHDTLIMDEAYGVPDEECNVITYMEGTRQVRCKYVKQPAGILPQILRYLLQARKDTRTRAKHVRAVNKYTGEVRTGLQKELDIGDGCDWDITNASNEFELKVLDGMQLAYKLTANSLYGQMGAVTSPVYLKPLAACTTATGRNLIQKAKSFMECERGGKVVYGDSVAEYTPVYLLMRGGVEICTVMAMSAKYGGTWYTIGRGAGAKEACEVPPGVLVWTDKGWTRVARIIRHKLPAWKRMLRVITGTGIVDVTEDHSLLLEDGCPVSPRDVVVGTRLLHCDLMNAETGGTERTAFEVGSRYSDKIPDFVISGPAAVRRAFVARMMCDSDLKHCKVGFTSQLEAARLFWTARSVGYNVTLSMNECNEYCVHICEWDIVEDNCAVKHIYQVGYDHEYVYDLTTENHHFAAGVGRMIVHNTDSVMVTFPHINVHGNNVDDRQRLLRATIDYAVSASAEFRTSLKPPHDLEYEKTFYPYIIFAKKRYVGNKYEQDVANFKQASMGIVLKRRDNAPIVKHVYGEALRIILDDLDIERAAYETKLRVRDVLNGKYPMDMFVVTKTLKGHYKAPAAIAHKVLADRVAEREPGNAFQSNDRVPHVHVKCKNRNALQGDKIETPEYATKKCLPIDYEYYVTNQIMKPVCQLFGLVVERLNGLYRDSPDLYEKRYNELIAKRRSELPRAEFARNKSRIEQEVLDKILLLKEQHAGRLLFEDLLREYRNRHNGQLTMHAYFKPT